MKKQILIMLVMAFSLNVTVAQTPEKIISRFKSDYPAASAIEWKTDGERFKVSFNDKENLHHLVIYDKDGTVYGSESELAEVSVPAPINTYFTMNFPDLKGTRVWMTEDETGTKSYYTPIDDAVLFFDKDGKFDRREPRTPQVMQPK